MAYLTWVVRILLFLLLLGLAARNLDPVHVHGFLGLEWQAPLSVVLLVTLMIGATLGVLASLGTALWLRKPPPEPAAELPVMPPPVAMMARSSPRSDDGSEAGA